ncbi:MAG: MBL fold metallo-hydrolase [Thermodesulfobacteriota bacterium]|nr:MBL fold metallo-hydrolase [Thermodesulfobacteriota bacterium]
MKTHLGIDIIHLGGEETVTGSCHLLQANGLNIMVDCGLAQGNDSVLPMKSWPVAPSDIDYLFLTHAHIDHIGRVPELIERGFSGEIICSHPTKALLIPMLQDAMGFTDWPEKKIDKLLRTIHDLSWGFEYREVFSLKKGIKFRLGCAGHILGSCWIQFDISDYMTVVFSGDLGVRDTPILCDPDVPEGCDLLIMESTYGDRNHEGRGDRIKRLGEILLRAITDGGKVFIPAFSLGRTQELIYEMDRIRQRSEVSGQRSEKDRPARNALACEAGGGRKSEVGDRKEIEVGGQKAEFRIPVFVDSPLGLEITKIYSSLSEYWDKEAKALKVKGDHPIDFEGLYAVGRFRDHKQLLEMEGLAIVIAGSGMCTGGRIVEHLKAGIEDPRNDILFVGYQANGTSGRDILKYSKRPGGYVMLDGEKFDIKAKVHQLTGYSAHADQKGLVEWIEAMPERPGRIKLVHGEIKAREAMRRALDESRWDLDE